MWHCSFTPYNAWKNFQDKITFLASYFVILFQTCHFLILTLFAVSARYTYIFTYVMLTQRLLIMTIYSYAMQSTFSAKQNSWTLLPKIDPCMIKDIIWCIIIRFAVFVALFSIWIRSQKLGFVIKHALKHGRCSLFMLELYCNHSFFYSDKLWADTVGWPCTLRMLDSFI